MLLVLGSSRWTKTFQLMLAMFELLVDVCFDLQLESADRDPTTGG